MNIYFLSLCCMLTSIACTSSQNTNQANHCFIPATPTGKPIAKIGSQIISDTQMIERIRQQKPNLTQKNITVPEIQQFIQDELKLELLAQSALERQLDKDPDVIQAARQVMVRKLLEHELKIDPNTVSEDDALKYYHQHIRDFMKPERREIEQLDFEPTQQGKLLAMQAIAKIRQYPKTPLPMKNIGFQTLEALEHDFGPYFATIAFSVPSGSIAPEPVQSIQGWHVIRIKTQQQAIARTFNEAKTQIQEILSNHERNKQFDAYVASMQNRFPVVLFDDNIQTMFEQLKSELP